MRGLYARPGRSIHPPAPRQAVPALLLPARGGLNVAGPSLPEKVLLLEEGFAGRGIPHAFGGALALAYYATPRATVDIDVNVFVPVARADE